MRNLHLSHALPAFRPSAHVIALGLILLIAIGLRAAWLAHVNVNPLDGRFDDSIFYYQVADSLAEGRGYVDPWGRGQTAQWPPAYPATLALAFLPLGKSLLAAKALNVALAVISVILTYLLASRLFDRRVGLLAALLLAVFPSRVYLSTLVMAENLFVPAFLLALLLMVTWGLAGRRPTALQSLAVGAAIAFAALTRAEGVWLLAPAVIVWFFASRGWAAAGRNITLVIVGAALLLTPWTVRNAIQLDKFILVRPASSSNLGRGLNPDYRDYPIGTPVEERPSIADNLRIYRREPWQAFVLLKDKIYDLYGNDRALVHWVRGNGPDPALTRAEFERWKSIANAVYYGIGAVALAGLALSLLTRNRRALFLGGVILTWTLGFALFVPSTRYHLALLPVLTTFAALPAVRLLPGAAPVRGVTRRLEPFLAGGTLAVGAAIAAVTIGLGYDGWTDSEGTQRVEAGTARLGETLTLGELEVTAQSFVLDPGESVARAPPSGHVWLVVDAAVTNTGDGDLLVSAFLQTAVQDAAGNGYAPAREPPVAQPLDGTVQPGETLQGTAIYAVPTDADGLQFMFRAVGVVGEGRWALE